MSTYTLEIVRSAYHNGCAITKAQNEAQEARLMALCPEGHFELVDTDNLDLWAFKVPADAIPAGYSVKRNLMSGEEYLEADDTPIYCSPASESYWSM